MRVMAAILRVFTALSSGECRNFSCPRTQIRRFTPIRGFAEVLTLSRLHPSLFLHSCLVSSHGYIFQLLIWRPGFSQLSLNEGHALTTLVLFWRSWWFGTYQTAWQQFKRRKCTGSTWWSIIPLIVIVKRIPCSRTFIFWKGDLIFKIGDFEWF